MIDTLCKVYLIIQFNVSNVHFQWKTDTSIRFVLFILVEFPRVLYFILMMYSLQTNNIIPVFVLCFLVLIKEQKQKISIDLHQ